MAPNKRVLSGMRPTGRLHLGHFHGVLDNWLKLQDQYECFFFVADWHALTSDYADPKNLKTNIREMILDWLSRRHRPRKEHRLRPERDKRARRALGTALDDNPALVA